LIRAPRPDELESIAALVAAQQARPESRDAQFDERPEAIAAQLSAWETPWVETSRVEERQGQLVGFVGAELDDSLSRVWIYGPAVAVPDWDAVADGLLATLESDVPGMTGKAAEIAGDVANERVAALARRHGFTAGKVHHLLELHAEGIARLARPAIGPVTPEYEPAFAALHDELFPGTYYSGRQLLDQARRGAAIVLALVDEGRLAGYAAGRIDEAGDGYLDFVGVAQNERRRGLGRLLVAAIGHAFGDRRPVDAMRLTVSSENVAALALYEQLGFERASSAIGYRRPGEPAA
jgi:ribosomal protein S18 acetylase RimI-like enzyme